MNGWMGGRCGGANDKRVRFYILAWRLGSGALGLHPLEDFYEGKALIFARMASRSIRDGEQQV